MTFLTFVDFFQLDVWLVPVVGVAFALVAILIGRLFFWISQSSSVPQLVGNSPNSKNHFFSGPEGITPHDPFDQGSIGEQRASVRRRGNPVEVLIVESEENPNPTFGWVVDRSVGGLCLAVGQPLSQGAILSVRSRNAPQDSPWIKIEVRSRRQKGKNWELGCKFLRTPNWSILLLFG